MLKKENRKHILIVLLGIVLCLGSFHSPAKAVVNQEVSFQGKVVDKTNGTNISPACVASGASNDTCDFRVTIYDAPSGGTALWSEIHTDVEIGHYSGVFSLSIGSYCITNQGGSWTTDGDGGGSRCTVSGGGVDWGADATIYLLVELDTANTVGANSFASPEVFSRKLLTTVPFAFHAEEAANLEGLAANSFVQLAPNAAQTTGNTSNTLINLNENGTGTPDLLDLQVAAGSVFKVNNSGAVAVGWGTNTGAWLAVNGSTASRAHLRLSSGTDPSAPASGDLWWNGSSLNFYDGTTTHDLLVSSNLFTDGGTITYLTATADDFAIGGTTLVSPFSVDESANTVRIGEGSGSNAIVNMYASDGDTGSIEYTTADNWLFTGGNIAVGGNVSPQVNITHNLGSSLLRWDALYLGSRLDLVDGSSNGGAIITEAGDALVVTDAGEIVLRPGASSSADILSAKSIPTAGNSGDLLSTTATLNAMNGTDTVRGYYLNLTNGNHTGATNNLYGIDIAAITGDAEATEYALQIGSGWDRGISAAGTIAFTTLTSCNSIVSDVSGVLSCGSGGDLFTDGGTVTYLTSTTDDFAIGGTTLTAPFSVDESANTVRIGEGSGSNGTISLHSTSGFGQLIYSTNDAFSFVQGSTSTIEVGIGTQSPGASLEVVNSGSNPAILLSGTSTGTALSLSRTGTGTTTDGIVIANTSTGAITDALDLSDAEIVNALNLGANNIVMTDGATINWDDSSGNRLIEISDIATNFGASVSAGAAVSLNSAFVEGFNRERTNITVDCSQCWGDTRYWNFDENTDCAALATDDAGGLGGVTSIVGTAAGNSHCQLIHGITGSTHTIFDADNLPVFIAKVAMTNSTAFTPYIGITSDGTTATNADPTNGIYFTRNNTSNIIRGVTRSGGTSTNVDCTGLAYPATGNLALIMFQVRSTSDVRFYADANPSNGINWTYCGQSTTNIPTSALSAVIRGVNLNNVRGIAVDYFHIWQDDSLSNPDESVSSDSSDVVSPESRKQLLLKMQEAIAAETVIAENQNYVAQQLRNLEISVGGIYTQDKLLELTKIVTFERGVSLDNLASSGSANFTSQVGFGGATVLGSSKFKSGVNFNTQQLGKQKAAPTETQLHIQFTKPFDVVPVVVANPSISTSYTIKNITKQGFDIEIKPSDQEIWFSWLAAPV